MTTSTLPPIPAISPSRTKLIRVLGSALVVVVAVVLAVALLHRGPHSTHSPAATQTGLQGGPAAIPAKAAPVTAGRVCTVGHLHGPC